jgi:nucleotide-binding universal stress UspA family protein
VNRALLDRVIVPVANEEDTEATCEAIEPYLDRIGELVFLHVVEHTEGYPDPAPPDTLEEDARRFLGLARDELGADRVDRMEVRFGIDASEEIADAVDEFVATAVVFRPRDKGLLARLIDKGGEAALIRASPVPVVALP